MYKFNIILTELCNANCSHCYMNLNSKKSKKTMSFDEIDTIIDKIPYNTSSITLTGGEIFLVKDLLFHTIKKIKDKNSKIKVELESNGIYIYKSDKPNDILVELKKIGVDYIRFSDDPFHQQGGVDLEKVRDLKGYESSGTPSIKFLIQDKVLKIGKATNLEDKYIEKRNCMNNSKTISNPYLFLDVKGNVSICTWKCVPPLGNLITDTFEEIEKKLEDDFWELILQGNIEEAIAYKEKKDIRILKKESLKNGQCYLCIKRYGGK